MDAMKKLPCDGVSTASEEAQDTESTASKSPALDSESRFSLPLSAASDGEERAEPPPLVPAPTGNLFLTCLRLRFEEAGSWSKALADPSERHKQGVERESSGSSSGEGKERDSVSTSEESLPAITSCDSIGSTGRPTWKAWAGRERGSDAYRPMDFARGGARLVAEKARQCRQQRHKLRTPCFGIAGAGLELSADPIDDTIETVAVAKADTLTSFAPLSEDHLHVPAAPCCIVTTFAPLSELGRAMFGGADNKDTKTAGDIDGCHSAPLRGVGVRSRTRRYYFEFKVLELSQQSRGAFSLGFSWGTPTFCQDDSEAVFSKAPAQASQLPKSFIIGGDFPHAYLDGVDLGKVAVWRPALHTFQGCVIGALLEISQTSRMASPRMRLIVFQDGVKQAESHATLSVSDSRWASARKYRPHGVIDVCRNLRGVQLLNPAGPPSGAGTV